MGNTHPNLPLLNFNYSVISLKNTLPNQKNYLSFTFPLINSLLMV